jgi:hypothetical protein
MNCEATLFPSPFFVAHNSVSHVHRWLHLIRLILLSQKPETARGQIVACNFLPCTCCTINSGVLKSLVIDVGYSVCNRRESDHN